MRTRAVAVTTVGPHARHASNHEVKIQRHYSHEAQEISVWLRRGRKASGVPTSVQAVLLEVVVGAIDLPLDISHV